ncbi:MAG: hypothetical protein IJ572_00805 [Bacilli bacterium]|nr:hypothetical protein [Bacilli bacterium]
MQKLFKNPIFTFILGAVIFSAVSVFAYSIIATNVGYTPLDNTFKDSNGQIIEDVSTALDSLYKRISKMEFKTLYEYSPGTPANYSYTIETNTKGVLVILSSIRDVTLGEADSTITIPNDYITLYDMTNSEAFNGRQGYGRTRVYYIENASGTISGRISYRGLIRIIQIN